MLTPLKALLMSCKLTLRELAKLIDHALLPATMTDAEIRQGCELARRCHVAAACVKPYAIALAREVLQGSDVAVCPVIGFPHGNSTTAIKVKEAEEAARAGGTEIDMVINVGKALGGDWDYVKAEIQAINDACLANSAILKVIFENDFLAESHIIKLCEICSAIGVAFVKTSTGFGFVRQENGMYAYKGATIPHLQLMRQHCAPTVKIKAAGGIRSLDELLAAKAAGADRIGTSATAVILEQARQRGFE
jgi:deoxyribose-phosphate aldolase